MKTDLTTLGFDTALERLRALHAEQQTQWDAVWESLEQAKQAAAEGDVKATRQALRRATKAELDAWGDNPELGSPMISLEDEFHALIGEHQE